MSSVLSMGRSFITLVRCKLEMAFDKLQVHPVFGERGWKLKQQRIQVADIWLARHVNTVPHRQTRQTDKQQQITAHSTVDTLSLTQYNIAHAFFRSFLHSCRGCCLPFYLFCFVWKIILGLCAPEKQRKRND